MDGTSMVAATGGIFILIAAVLMTQILPTLKTYRRHIPGEGLMIEQRKQPSEAIRTATADFAAEIARDGEHRRDEIASQGRSEPLITSSDGQDLRGQWANIQSGFVDNPKGAVEAADNLVADAIGRLVDRFSGERKDLEQQLARNDATTEDLRLTLQGYRRALDRLLALQS